MIEVRVSPFDGVPRRVSIVEVGPRDGLQNEARTVPTEAKARFIGLLAAAGVRRIEATSFVNPRAVPQLADAAELAALLPPVEGVTYSALVPNARGLERALRAGLREVAVFTGATDGFTRANIGMTVAESLEVFRPVITRARAEGVRVRGYVSVAWGCPYDGAVAPARVREVALRLLALGASEVSLGDTIGAATPAEIPMVAGPILEEAGVERVALHLHDTRGTALANALAGLLIGVRTFDASAAGLGGCPYVPGASGNLATEDLLYMLDGMGIETGVSLPGVVAASRAILAALGRAPTSRYLQSVGATGQDDHGHTGA